jgi:succinate dehydrogenase / fumarate reductase flavoprotein subunit
VSAPPAADSAQIEEAEREMLDPFARPAGESPYAIHHDLQETMQNLVGIFRSADDLKRGLSEIDKLKERQARVRVEGSRLFNPGWHLARDLKSMLTVSEAVAKSALARQESRGAHSRIDYPKLDPAWGKSNNVVARDGEAMKLFQRPIPEMPADLAALVAQK